MSEQFDAEYEAEKLRDLSQRTYAVDTGYCNMLDHVLWHEVGVWLDRVLAERKWLKARIAAQSERIEWTTGQNAELLALVRRLQSHMNEGAQP